MRDPISSEDPKAIELLREKQAKLEGQRDKMKAVNKTWKKAEKRARTDKSGNVGDYFEAFLLADKIMETIPVGFGNTMMARIEKAYSWEKQPYAGWAITNIGATIRQVKKRIEGLVAHQDDETTESTINGVRVIDNVEDHRLQLFFDDKPDSQTRMLLKQNGFRWTPSKECWQSYRGQYQNERAERILKDMAVPA